jgi:hypothetical protein
MMKIARLSILRHERLVGILHEYQNVACPVSLLSAVLQERDAEDGVFLTTEDGETPLSWAAFDALGPLRRHGDVADRRRPHRPAARRNPRRSSCPKLVHTTIAVVDGLQQQWLLQPDRVSMVKKFGTYLAMLRASWDTATLPKQ